MLCFYHSDVDNLASSPATSSMLSTSSPATSSMLSSRQSSVEPLPEPSQGLPSKRKRKLDKANEDVDSLLVRNLKALEEPLQEDEEELFGRQVAIALRRLTARQMAHAKLKIQSILVETEFPDLAYTPEPYYQTQCHFHD